MKKNQSLVVFSELTGKKVNMNKPFALFISTNPVFFQSVDVDGKITLSLQDKLNPDCMVIKDYSPYQDFCAFFEYVNGKLNFYGDYHKSYLSNNFIGLLFNQFNAGFNIDLPKISFQEPIDEEKFLTFIEKLIQANFEKEPLKYHNNEVIMNFLDLESFNIITKMRSKFYENHFRGYMLKDYNEFHKETFLIHFLEKINNTIQGDSALNLQSINEVEKNTQYISDGFMFIYDSHNHNKYLSYQRIIRNIASIILRKISRDGANKKEKLQDTFDSFIAQYKEYVSNNMEQLKWSTIVPFFESNRIPFRSEILTREQYINKKRIWLALNGTLKHSSKNSDYFRSKK